jgi:hypothetical protein
LERLGPPHKRNTQQINHLAALKFGFASHRPLLKPCCANTAILHRRILFRYAEARSENAGTGSRPNGRQQLIPPDGV